MTIYDTVADLLRQAVVDEKPAKHIIFNSDGLAHAKMEEVPGVNRFTMGGPNTFMGLPYRVDVFQKELVTVSPDDPPRPKLMDQMIGTPEPNHVMTVRHLRDTLDAILDICEPSPQYPVPLITFPNGFQIVYATREEPVDLWRYSDD